MVWPPIYSVSLTFAGCPLQLYLLRMMFCSGAYRKIILRIWFFQMLFNKSLIKCENFVSCLMQYSKKYLKWPETYVLILHIYWTPQLQNLLFFLYEKSLELGFYQMFFNKSLVKCKKFVSCLMQYSKKYWKWPETYVLILHIYWTPQFQNFAIPPIWLSSHSITQRYCYPCITFSLHNFKLLPIYQLEFLGIVIPLFFFFLRFLRNYVSIIVSIISNDTVLQCSLFWIFVSTRRLLQLIMCIGVSLSPAPHLKNIITSFFPFFASPLLNLQTIQFLPLLGDSPPPPPKKFVFFMNPSTSKKIKKLAFFGELL